ncbi:MAG: efflux RND transporter permease subunit [Phycisphaerales bacterium]|nr:efflux RND transporter permease subunit [Phycisphaerales bacterium]
MSFARFGVRKPVVANLVMFAIIGAGLIFGTGLRREFFPYVESRIITIMAPYPGAAPEEVEDALATKIEDKVADLTSVKEITSTVSEGAASVVVEFEEGMPIQQALADVKREIDSIQDLPDAVDNIVVDILEPNMPAIIVALYGEADERTMKDFIIQTRDDLLSLPEITDVSMGGVRSDELRIEVSPENAIEYGVSLPTISDKIRSAMVELPGGSVRTATSTISIRSVGVEERADTVREIVIKANGDGGVVRVGDVAQVYDGFVDTDLITRYEGHPTVTLTVFRVGDQDVIRISEFVKAYVKGRNGDELDLSKSEQMKASRASPGSDPSSVSPRYAAWKLGYDRFEIASPPGTLVTTTDLARFVEGRLDLLLRNAMFGGLLVFITLVLLLNWRISFWVAMGLVVSLLGTLALMSVLDISLNFLTMFGLIIVIGILVDDAIVVAENITTRHEKGEPALVAAVNGADQVAWPVVSTVLTTIFAFLPLALMNGQIGDFMNVMPVVVGCALGVSLIESLFILPMHMGHSLRSVDKIRANGKKKHRFALFGAIARLEAKYDKGRDHIISGRIIPTYAKLLRVSMSYRYVTLSVVIGILIVSLGMVASGKLQFILFETDDAETVNISVTMPIGTPVHQTDEIVRRYERVCIELPEVKSTFAMAGAVSDLEGAGGDSSSSHVGQVILELTSAESRDRSSATIIEEIREKVGDISMAKNVRMEGVSGGPSGPALNFTVAGESIEQLDDAVGRIKKILSEYEAVHTISDDSDRGQRELRFTLRDGASELGFTRAEVGRQIQAAVFGLEAFTFAGNREDIDVRVTVPDRIRKSTVNIEDMFVFTPEGVPVALGEVADIEESQAYATIRRLNRQRSISVQADVYRQLANPDSFAREVKPRLVEAIADLHSVNLVERGRQKDFADSMKSLPVGMMVASGLIYVVLAWLFSSFTQPLVVMLAIPFAMIGMIWGHILMENSMTFLSMIGFIALAGIVVNDSLIFMEFFNERRSQGMSVYDAGVATGQARFRAIMLTTITTVFGILPLMLEQSFQAKFLVPMAITIAFGLMSATFIILLVLPSLLMILDDVVHVIRVAWTGNIHLERKNPKIVDPEIAML